MVREDVRVKNPTSFFASPSLHSTEVDLLISTSFNFSLSIGMNVNGGQQGASGEGEGELMGGAAEQHPTSNIWKGLESLKQLVQVESDSRHSQISSSQNHPFSRFQPKLSVHHPHPPTSSNSTSTCTPSSLKEAVMNQIDQLELSISNFKSNHSDKLLTSTTSRLASLLKQSSTHLTSISSTLSSFPPSQQLSQHRCHDDDQILFLPESLSIGRLAQPSTSTSSSSSTTQALQNLDSFSNALTAIAQSLGLESFTDHLIQVGDPRLESEAELLQVQTLTLGGKVLVIDLDFSLSISKLQDGSQFKSKPSCKLKISYASDSPDSKVKRDSRLGLLLQNEIEVLLNLIFCGREDGFDENSSDLVHRYQAPIEAIKHLEHFRRNLKVLARLDWLGGLHLGSFKSKDGIGSANGNPQTSVDPFDLMDSFVKEAERIGELEEVESSRKTLEENGDEMEVDGSEGSEKISRLRLSQGHGITLVHDPNPYLTLAYHLSHKLCQSHLNAASISSLIKSQSSTSKPLELEIHSLQVAVDLVLRRQEDSNEDLNPLTRSTWNLLTSTPLESSLLSSPPPGVLSNAEGLKLSYVVKLDPPVLCSRLTAREIAKASGRHQTTQATLQDFHHTSSASSNTAYKDSQASESNFKHSNYLFSLLLPPSNTRSNQPNFSVSMQGINFEVTDSFDSKNSISPTLDNEIFEIAFIPFKSLDGFYRIVEILKDQVEVEDLLKGLRRGKEEVDKNVNQEVKTSGKRKRDGTEDRGRRKSSGEEGELEDDLDLDALLADEAEEMDNIVGAELDETAILKIKRVGDLPVNVSVRYPSEVQADGQGSQDGYRPMSIDFGFPLQSSNHFYTLQGSLSPSSSFESGWDIDVRVKKVENLKSKNQDQSEEDQEMLMLTQKDKHQILDFMLRASADTEAQDMNSQDQRLIRLVLSLEWILGRRIQARSKAAPVPAEVLPQAATTKSKSKKEVEQSTSTSTQSSRSRPKPAPFPLPPGVSTRRRSSGQASASSVGGSGSGMASENTRSSRSRSRSGSPVKERKK